MRRGQDGRSCSVCEQDDDWRPGDPFPEEARERSLQWVKEVLRAEGKVLVGWIDADGQDVGPTARR
jgi:hypothetical protein